MIRPPRRSYIVASMAFLTLGLTLSNAVDARQRLAKTPYGQARQAVDSISELVVEMSEDIDARLVNGEEGPVLDCLQSHRTATITLRDLADAERARLVEALADGDQATVTLAHRNVMLWHVKAKVTAEEAGECTASS